mgnify:CR=1 FL=1
MSGSVSQRKFAEHIGRSNVWVSKLVKAGRLPVDADGKIPLADGLAAYEASQQVGYDGNRAHAAKQRSASAKAKASPRAAATKAPPLPAAAHQTTTLGDDDEADAPLPATGLVSVDKVNAAYNRARLAEKTYQAKLKELEYKEAQGLVLSLAEVEKDAEETAGALREKLMSLPPRIAPLCEGKPAREIEGVLDEAINDALLALSRSRFAKE